METSLSCLVLEVSIGRAANPSSLPGGRAFGERMGELGTGLYANKKLRSRLLFRLGRNASCVPGNGRGRWTLGCAYLSCIQELCPRFVLHIRSRKYIPLLQRREHSHLSSQYEIEVHLKYFYISFFYCMTFSQMGKPKCKGSVPLAYCFPKCVLNMPPSSLCVFANLQMHKAIIHSRHQSPLPGLLLLARVKRHRAYYSFCSQQPEQAFSLKQNPDVQRDPLTSINPPNPYFLDICV